MAVKHNVGGAAGLPTKGGAAGLPGGGDAVDKPASEEWLCTGGPCDPQHLIDVKLVDACTKSVKANVPDPKKAVFGSMRVNPGVESHASILRDFQPENGDKLYLVTGSVDANGVGNFVDFVCDAYYGPDGRLDAFAYPKK